MKHKGVFKTGINVQYSFQICLDFLNDSPFANFYTTEVLREYYWWAEISYWASRLRGVDMATRFVVGVEEGGGGGGAGENRMVYNEEK